MGIVVTHTSDVAYLAAALATCEERQVPVVLAHASLREEEVRELCQDVGAPAFLNGALEWVPVSGSMKALAGPFTVSLMTSGTTGRPKLVRHRLDRLLGRIATTPAPPTQQRWLLGYQPTGFAGLQVVLHALCTGGAVVQAADRRPANLAVAAETFGATHISGTPTFWRSFLLAASPGFVVAATDHAGRGGRGSTHAGSAAAAVSGRAYHPRLRLSRSRGAVRCARRLARGSRVRGSVIAPAASASVSARACSRWRALGGCWNTPASPRRP